MPHRLKSNIRFLDKSFKEDQTHLYILSMMYDKYGFTFTLFNTQQNKFIGFFSFPLSEKEDKRNVNVDLDKLLAEYNWLSSDFNQVNFLLSNSYSTLVPLPLFDDKKADTYLKFNQPEIADSEINYDSLKNTLAANIFYCPIGLVQKANEIWPNSKIIHSSSALLEILAINFKNLTDDKQVFVNVLEDRFELVYFKHNKLHFYNSFKYKTKEDFIYFLLAAFEQLSLNPEEVRLVLLGIVNKDGKLYEIIYQYIRHIEFIEQNQNFKYSHVMDEVMAHYYYVLFNVLQCEL